MVATITGNSLGLALSNSSPSGQSGMGRADERVYVNAANGNLVIQGSDEYLASIGLDTTLLRTYNSRGALVDDNGDNWQLNVGVLVNRPTTPNSAGSRVTKRFGDGAEAVYTYDTTRGLYVSSEGDGAADTLRFSANEWTWTDGSSREIEIYNSSGRLVTARDRDGNTRSYFYTGNLLNRIRDASGQDTHVEYSGNNIVRIRVVSQNNVSQILTRYGYDSSNRLTSVTVDLSPPDNVITDGRIYVTTYTYDGTSRRISTITQTDGTKLTFTYDTAGRVKTYTDALGQMTTLNYTAAGASTTVTAQAIPGSFTPVPVGWESAALRETSPAGIDGGPVLKYDAQGNAMALWTTVTQQVFATRYTQSTNSWSEPELVATGTGTGRVFVSFSMRPDGTAFFAWTQQNAANPIYARLYRNGVWEANEELTGFPASASFRQPIGMVGDNGEMAIAILQPKSAGDTTTNLLISRRVGNAWSEVVALDDIAGVNNNPVLSTTFGVDADGDVIVTWRQASPGEPNASLYTSRFTVATNSWSTPSATALETGPGEVLLQSKASDAQDNTMITWVQGGHLYARHFMQSTARWGETVDLGATYADVSQIFPRLVGSANGNALVSWRDETNHVRVRSFVNGAWDAGSVINPAGTVDVFPPFAGINDNGDAVLTFKGTVGADSNSHIYATRLTAGVWSTPALIDNPAGVPPTHFIAAGIDARGHAHVLWSQRLPGETAISAFSRRFNNDPAAAAYTVQAGDTWETIAGRVYGNTQAGSALRSQMGAPALTVGVVLNLPLTLTYTAIGVTVNALPGSLTTVPSGWGAEELRENSDLDLPGGPVTRYNTRGDGVSYWSTSATEYVVSVYTQSTNTWSEPKTLISGFTPTVFLPRVSPNGDVFVHWIQDGRVYTQWYKSGRWEAPERVENLQLTATQNAISTIGEAGDVALAIIDRIPDGAVYPFYRKEVLVLRRVAGVWQAPVSVPSSTNNNPIRAPKIAIDQRGDIAVTWMHLTSTTRDGDLWTTDLYTTRFTAATNVWSTPTLLAANVRIGSLNGYSAAFGMQGNGMLVWTDNGSVYARQYVQSNNTWGSVQRLGAHYNGDFSYLEPNLAVSDNGNALVSWKEGPTTMRARRFINGAWDTGGGVMNPGGVTTRYQQTGNINDNGDAVVIFANAIEEGIASDIHYLYASRFSNGSWETTPTRIREGRYQAGFMGVGINAQGHISAAWSSKKSGENQYSVFSTHFNNGPAFNYAVAAGDTFATIATKVYGDPNAASALQTHLGNPTLTTGARLTLPSSLTYTTNQTDVFDTAGRTTSYRTDANGRLLEVLSPTVSGVRASTHYQYDTRGNVVQVTDALNQVTVFQYDANDNLLMSRDAAGNTVTYTYNSANQRLTETRYLVSDPDGAGSAQPSQPLPTRYVYDSEQHLRFVISAAGRVSEQRYLANGSVSASIRYVGGTYTATGSSETNLVDWAAAQDRRRTQRTDYTYDFRGQVQTATTYYTVNTSGVGVSDGTQALTQFIYDQRGNLLKTISGKGDTVDYTYDGMGRIRTTVQWLTASQSVTTFTDYDDVNAKTKVTLANGLVKTSTYDKASRLVSVIDTNPANQVLGTTQYFYDSLNRLRMTQDPIGVRAFRFYDEAGRLIGQVDGDGSVTEYRFNQNDQVTHTIAYATALASVTLASLIDANGRPSTVGFDDIRPNTTIDDINVWQIYDVAGRLVKTVDSVGAITETTYDGVSRVKHSVTYFNRLDRTALNALGDTPTSAQASVVGLPANDRYVRHFYDNDGLLRATIDGESFATEYRYDQGGRLTETIRYANPATLGTSFAAPTSHPDDQYSYHYYNARGECIGTVDAERYLTEYKYDKAGNRTHTIRYANKAVGTVNANSALATLRPAVNPEDRTSIAVYDALNRVFQETNPEGVITQYAYDNVGNLIRADKAFGTVDVRIAQARYDLQGNLVGELTGEGSRRITAGMSQPQIDAIWRDYGLTHTYDAGRHRTTTTDQYGNKTRFYYDVDGRLTHAVNALGEVSESQYNALGELTATIQYDTRISLSTLAALNGGLINTALIQAINGIKNTAVDRKTGKAHERRTFFGGNTLWHTYTDTDALGVSTTRTLNTYGERTFDDRWSTDSADIDPVTGRSRREFIDADATPDRRGLLRTTFRYTLINGTGAPLEMTKVEGSYDAFRRIKTNTDGNGNITTFVYDRLGQVVQTIDAANSNRYTTYDAFGRTLTQTDALIQNTSYLYNKAERSITITTPEGIPTKTFYNLHGEVERIVDGRGNTTSYQYDKDGNVLSVTDAAGTESTDYDRAGRIYIARDKNGNRVKFEYDAAHRLFVRTVDPKTIVNPNDNPNGLNLVTSYQYDAKGDRIEITDAGGTVTKLEYDRKGQLLREIVDPTGLNLVTSYTYEGRGLVLTATTGDPTNPTVTRYHYDAQGRRDSEVVNGVMHCRYQYDANNNVTAKIDALGNVTRFYYDQFNRQIYELNATGGLTHTVYDVEGQMVREVVYATLLTADGFPSVPTKADIDVRVAVVSDASRDHVGRAVYDRDGRLIYNINALGEVTKNTYDGNGNVTQSTRYVNTIPASTAMTVAAVSAAIVANPARDQTVRYTYDAAGLLTGVAQLDAAGNPLGTTRYFYDAAGRPTMTQDPLGLRTFTLYDAADRKVADIDANGTLVEYSYDANGNTTRAYAYATALSASALASLVGVNGQPTNPALSTLRPTIIAASDRPTWFVYDAAGRLSKEISAEGAVTETVYDQASRISSIIQRSTKLSSAPGVPPWGVNVTSVTSGMATVATDSVRDRVEYRYYDNEGREVAAVDAERYLTEFVYDVAGRLAVKKGYATQLAADWLSLIPLNANGVQVIGAIRPGATSDDVLTKRIYDANNRAVGEIDGENYFTETAYDTLGNVTSSKRYANRVSAAFVVGVSTVDSVRPTADAEDRATVREFDREGRLVRETNPEGTVTEHTYNTLGQLVRSERAPRTGDARVSQVRYDLQGRIVGELAGEGSEALAGLTAPTQAQIDAIWRDWGLTHVYDAADQRTSTTDQYGNKTLYYYNEDGQLRFSINALGEVSEMRYSTLGDVTDTIVYGTRLSGATLTTLAGGLVNATVANAINAIANAGLDSKVSTTYYNTGAAATTTDALGATTANSYNAFGELTSSELIDPTSGRRFIDGYTYDRRGFVTQTRAAEGALTTPNARSIDMMYDAFGRATSTTNGNGKVTSYVYDRLGRTVESRPPFGGQSTAYDAFGRITSITDANQVTTQYLYNKAERRLTLTSPEGVVIKTTYNVHGEVESITDGNNAATWFGYDNDGHQIVVSDALDNDSHINFDRAGRVETTVDRNGTVVKFAYDKANRLFTRTVDPAGLNLATSYRYDPQGNQIEITDANEVLTKLQYDLKGQLRHQTVDPTGLNLVTSYDYDSRGLVTAVTDPNNVETRYHYDSLGRRDSESVNGIVQRTYQYDGNDRVVASTDALMNTTRYVYNHFDQLAYIVDATGAVTQNDYDAKGRATRTVSYATRLNDFENLPIVATVAQVQARMAIDPPHDMATYQVYDKDDRRTATVNALGEVVKFKYDGNGNVIESVAFATRINMTSWVPGTEPFPADDTHHDRRERTVHDANNRAIYTLIDVSGGFALTEQHYDAVGNVIERLTYSHTIPYSQTIPAAGIITADDVREAMDGFADASRDVRTRMVYDKAGRLTHTVDGAGAVSRAFYDRNGNIVKTVQYATAIGASALPTSAIADNARDRVTIHTYDNANREVYALDTLGGLSQRRYDKNGNVVQTLAFADPVTLPTETTAHTTASLDALVTLEMRSNPRNRLGYATYDAQNRQILAVNAEGAVTKHEYDAVGNPVQTTAYANRVPLEVVNAENADQVLPNLVNAVADARYDRITKNEYDAVGRHIASMDALGYVIETQYNATGQITRTVQYGAPIPTEIESPNIVSYVRTQLGHVSFHRHSNFDYDAGGRLLVSTDAYGFTESYSYDGVGNRTSFVNKKGATWNYDYDSAGRLVKETSPTVYVTHLSQNGAQGVLDIDAAESQARRLDTVFTYDAIGNVTSRSEAYGLSEQRTTRYEYDALGRQIKTIHPGVYVYDENTDNLDTNGSTGIATRRETLRILTTEIRYDTLGNAYLGYDMAGNHTAKVYDRAGQLRYEVDAMGYVTGYRRNAFGETIETTRYAVDSGLGNTVSQFNIADVNNALSALDHTQDRSLTIEYDAVGRQVEVRESAGFVYDPDFGSFAAFTAAKTTRTSYNAFGDVFQVAQLKNPFGNTWNYVTTNYYDKAGRLAQQVDALGYVTMQDYDAADNLKERREYELSLQDITGTPWNGAAPPLDPPSIDNSEWTPSARITRYGYDLLDRMTSMTRVGVEYADSGTVAPTTPATRDGIFTATADLTETYGYDAVGNRVRVTDSDLNSTYTYYDALGRTIATVAPPRQAMAHATLGVFTGRPLTEFRYDANGNVVATIGYAHGAASANELSYTYPSGPAPIPSPVPATRATFAQYDALGHATQTTDALGVNHYVSYRADGQVAKSWQGQTDHEGVTRTVYEMHRYDILGRLTETLVPAGEGSGITTTAHVYNSFGELTRKSVSGAGAPVGGQEYYDYDTAGRLWRTNQGDGVDKIFLYDLAGNVTAEIASGGIGGNDVDLKTIDDAQDASSLTRVRRSDHYYDAMGRVTKTVLPEREIQTFGVDADPTVLQSHIDRSAWPDIVPNGEGNTDLFWRDSNLVTLDLESVDVGGRSGGLALLGSGDVRVTLFYQTRPYGERESAAASRSFILTSDQQRDGTLELLWNDFDGSADGGIQSITSILLAKKDVNGEWMPLAIQASATPSVQRTNALYVTAPNDGSTVTLTLTQNENPVSILPAVNFGEVLRYDLKNLASGTYQYTVTLTAPDGVGRRTLNIGSLTLDQGNGSATGNISFSDTIATARPVINRTVDRWGNLLAINDARSTNWVTQFSYNANNQVTRVVKPMQSVPGFSFPFAPTTMFLYDKLGREFGSVEVHNYHYDNELNRYVFDHNVNTSRYDDGGNLVQERHADGGFIDHVYDLFGNRVKTVDAMNNVTTFEYDALGRLVKTRRPPVIDGHYTTTLQGNQTSSSFVETTQYDELGHKIRITNGNLETTTFRYDRRGNLIETILPLGQSTKYEYDAQGRKTKETDANLNSSSWSYDYFGRTRLHFDLGGALYTYNYDNAGQQTSQIKAAGNIASINYRYDIAGRMIEARQIQLVNIFGTIVSNNTLTSYSYDAAGNRVREVTVRERDGLVAQDNHIRYDAQGRMTEVTDGRAYVAIDYDLIGNRRHIHTRVLDDSTDTLKEQHRYFRYDAMNRQVVVDAQNLNAADGSLAQLGTHGHFVTYDKNGNRTSDTSYREKVVVRSGEQGTITAYDPLGRAMYSNTTYANQGAGLSTEVYRYDSMNQLRAILRDDVLVDYRTYDYAGRLTESRPYLAVPDRYVSAQGGANGIVKGLEGRANSYDSNGRLRKQWIIATSGFVEYRIDYDLEGSYDAAGNLKKYQLTNYEGDGYTNTYTYTYKLFDGYRVDTIDGTSTAFSAGKTTHYYDLFGNLVGVDDTAQPESDKSFVNDIGGRTLQATQHHQVQHQLIANGELIGRYGQAVDPANPRNNNGKPNFAFLADFNFGYQAIGPNYPIAAPGQYSVRAGDTLQAIAQGAYGNSSLWYLIADANGLTGAETLQAGQLLTIPNRVATAHNNAGTYTPYDANPVMGDTTPFLPQGDGGCGGFGLILAVAIAVAVAVVISVLTYGTAAPLMASALGTTLAAATTAEAVAIGIVAGAAAGVAGSLASQTMLNLFGVQQGINTNQLWISGATGAFAGGAGAYFGTAANAASQAPTASTIARNALINASIAMGTNIVGQRVGMALGEQEKFNWTSLAISTISGAVPGAQGHSGKAVAIRAGVDMAAGIAYHTLRDPSWKGGAMQLGLIAADAFGNALGSYVAGNVVARMAERERTDKLNLTLPEMKITKETIATGKAREMERLAAELDQIDSVAGLVKKYEELKNTVGLFGACASLSLQDCAAMWSQRYDYVKPRAAETPGSSLTDRTMISGGSAGDHDKLLDVLRDLDSSPQGQYINTMIGSKPITINIDDSMSIAVGPSSDISERVINMPPAYLDPIMGYKTSTGAEYPITPDSALAHELWHLVPSTLDEPDIRAGENRYHLEIGQPERRVYADRNDLESYRSMTQLEILDKLPPWEWPKYVSAAASPMDRAFNSPQSMMSGVDDSLSWQQFVSDHYDEFRADALHVSDGNGGYMTLPPNDLVRSMVGPRGINVFDDYPDERVTSDVGRQLGARRSPIASVYSVNDGAIVDQLRGDDDAYYSYGPQSSGVDLPLTTFGDNVSSAMSDVLSSAKDLGVNMLRAINEPVWVLHDIALASYGLAKDNDDLQLRSMFAERVLSTPDTLANNLINAGRFSLESAATILPTEQIFLKMWGHAAMAATAVANKLAPTWVGRGAKATSRFMGDVVEAMGFYRNKGGVVVHLPVKEPNDPKYLAYMNEMMTRSRALHRRQETQRLLTLEREQLLKHLQGKRMANDNRVPAGIGILPGKVTMDDLVWLGAGGEKSVYALRANDNLAVGIYDNPLTMLFDKKDVMKRINAAKFLEENGVPTVKVLGYDIIDGKHAIWMENIKNGMEFMSVVGKPKFHSRINDQTLADLLHIEATFKSKNIIVDDLQFIIDPKGRALVFDSMHASKRPPGLGKSHDMWMELVLTHTRNILKNKSGL